MDPRPSLIACLACAIVLAGCAASDHNGGDNDLGAPTDGGGGSGGGGGGADMGMSGCVTTGITISFQWTASSPPLLGRITASATATAYGIPTWRIDLNGKVLSPTAGQGTLMAQLDVTDPGEYRFVFDNGFGCTASATYPVNAVDGIPASYIFRVSAPSGVGAPIKDFSETIYGGTRPGLRVLMLDAGLPIASVLTTAGAGAHAVAGEVRFLAAAGPDALATASRTAPVGRFTLFVAPAVRYRPLLIPFDPTLAPMIFATDDTGMSLANLVTTSPTSPFVVDAGATVSGSVSGTSGPLQANVVLHAGPLPSSVGSTAADGSFVLHAQASAGPYDVEVGAVGWPTITLPGVAVPAAGTSLQIAYTAPLFTVGGSVVSSKGTPLVGAHVTVVSRAAHPIANAATIAVGGNAAVAVAGRVNQVVVTLPGGALPPLALPAGDYDLLIDPTGSTPVATGDGISFAQATLSGAATWSLKLAPKVTLTGTVMDTASPPRPVAGANIVAVESGGFGPAFTTSSSSDPTQLGRFSLLVDAGADLDLAIDPPATNTGLANASVHVARGTTSTMIVLGPGFAVPTQVTLNGAPIPGALVQVLAPDGSAPAPSRVTDSNGDVTVYVSDPGEVGVDGGTARRQNP